jgi:5'-phosphate synthase pdxT subunit
VIAVEKPKIGILALQGCVQPHLPHLESLGAVGVEVRQAADLSSLNGLILPGGESTVLLKLIHTFQLEEGLRAVFSRIPIWGICAGAILVAKKVSAPAQPSFDLIDIEVERNAYGRQLNSFHTLIHDYPVSFIRAPRILKCGAEVKIHAEYQGSAVWVQSGKVMVTTFHPELTPDTPSPMHRLFMKWVTAGLLDIEARH